jgi:membrane-bound lytic murein transglycosylase A
VAGDSKHRSRLRHGALALALVALASCAPRLVPPAHPPVVEPVKPPPPANATAAGVTPVALPELDPVSAARALQAFRISCPALVKRQDASGLTAPDDWRPVCDAAQAATVPAQFFQTQFAGVRVGEGAAFVTGYYEPQIRASRTQMPGYEVPIYARPADLAVTDPVTGETKTGRIVDGQYALYYDRTEIEEGALAGRGLEIAWAADPIELFFLQIQGSGRLLLPDGSIMRIGYAGQNGREYVGIGKLMKERGLLGPGQTTMQGIVAWLREHPDEGRALMRENKSYVFFKELTGAGPLGALGLPVTPRGSVAADPRFAPLGGPVLLRLDRAEASGLWVAQDTGGAIKGANRFDTFWGAGEEAALVAGGMQGKGEAILLLPKASVARLDARPQP